MYERMDEVTLKSGEKVEMGVVIGPDLEWAERIDSDLLAHKGPIWQWGNRKVLREEVDLEAYFYILHWDGAPFANVMNIEYRGVGILGHVFTRPEERRQGACSEIFERLMPHFRERGGKALVLGTGYDSAPYHIYRAYGFEGIEPQSGTMVYYTASKEEFEAAYFAQGPVAVERLDWPHWPASPPLFVWDYPGVVRCVGMPQVGRYSTEGALLPVMREELERIEAGRPAGTVVLKQQETTAVVGLATSRRDSQWPGRGLVDLYCHPDFWDRAGDLLDAIALPEAYRYTAYCDAGFESKEQALAGAGFRQTATLKEWAAKDRAVTGFVDVGVWER